MSGHFFRRVTTLDGRLLARKPSLATMLAFLSLMASVCVFVDAASSGQPRAQPAVTTKAGLRSKYSSGRYTPPKDIVTDLNSYPDVESAFKALRDLAKEHNQKLSQTKLKGRIAGVQGTFVFDSSGRLNVRTSGAFSSTNAAHSRAKDIARILKTDITSVLISGTIERNGHNVSGTFSFDDAGKITVTITDSFRFSATHSVNSMAKAFGISPTQVKVAGQIGDVLGIFGFDAKGEVASVLLSGTNCTSEAAVRERVAAPAGQLEIPHSSVTVEGNINGIWGYYTVNETGHVVGPLGGSRSVADKERGGAQLGSRETKQQEYRTWKDITGQYKIKAAFAGMAFGNVKLRKKEGGEITLPLAKLSEEDQKWIAERR